MKAGQRTDHYATLDLGHEEHPVTHEAEKRLSRQHKGLWRRIRRLNGRLADALQGELKRLFLDLEAAMNHRSSLHQAEHFNMGVEHGRQIGLAESLIDQHVPTALRAIATALQHLAERLDAQ